MKPIDVVLFIPPSPWLISDQDMIPLGILYLAGWIRTLGFSVEVVDISKETYKSDYKIPEAMYYGIGFVTPQLVYVKDILNKIRTNYPNAVVLAGGPHATALPKEMLKLGFSAVIRGEGEKALEQILTKGLEKTIYELNYVENIDSLPLPAFDLIDMESYVSNIGVVWYLGNVREINVLASRGCVGKCVYCTKFKGPLRWRTPVNVISELLKLQEEYKIGRFHFCDDNFITNPLWVREMCCLLDKHKIQWHCLGRADMLNKKTANLLFQSGCKGIDFGIESGSQKVLDIVQKQVKVEKQEEGIRNAFESGLKVRAQFMVGLPGETNEDHVLNCKFIKRNNDYVAKWGFHVFVPYPTCDVWENPDNYGYKVDKDTSFEEYQTIGKPKQWAFAPPGQRDVLKNRLNDFFEIVGTKDISYTE